MQQEREGATKRSEMLVPELMEKIPEGSKVHLYSLAPVERQGGKQRLESDKAT